MNLPIEAPDNEADLNATLVGVLPVVRAILMKKSGMSLAASDLRRDNQQAIDLCQDVVLKLWERLAGGVPDEDPPGVSISARASMSRTSEESHERLISSVFATGGVGAALINAMNSSMFASATARPSST